MEPISRRRALQLGGLGLASSIVGGVGLAWGGNSRFEPVTGAAMVEPQVLRSADGLLQVRLEAAEGSVRVAGREATALGYNGGFPGPTLLLQPGDRLRVQLANRLGDPTNLHVHGLHVSPEGNGDNAFVTVDAGESFDYDYQLPDDHPPGVYWYHPHLHGMVAEQVFGGLYGAIIVADVQELPVTRERVLVISDITFDGSGRIPPASSTARMMGREGDLLLVNGQASPVLNARPGERERWRVVNACAARYLRLSLDGQQVQLLGFDSGRLPAPQDVEEVVLAPGNRADLLVTAGQGSSQLQALPYDRGAMMGMMGSGGNSSATGTAVTVAALEVAGSEVAALPPVPAQPEPRDLQGMAVTARRELTFAMGMAMGGGAMSFTIDGNEFDPDRVDQEVSVGTIEEWTITNNSPMDHPLHLHVWPMQIVEQDGQPIRDPSWQDVVNVPAESRVKVRVAFDAFPGRTVYHCHILDHEDSGMMGVINAS
ncbi:MAG: multicopper oxidase family protein [Geodermatophilaceae bacterium]